MSTGAAPARKAAHRLFGFSALCELWESRSNTLVARMPAGDRGVRDTDAVRVAVIDIGTNSTRLLIADVEGTTVREVERRTTVTNMGRGVDHTGMICSDAVDDVCTVIADYKARYEEMGAERVMAIATSAVRDAVNGEAFIAELRERFGLDARLLTGEEEATSPISARPPIAQGIRPDPRLRHRRRLDRADRRLRDGGRLPRLAAGRHDPPVRASPDLGSAGPARARGPRRRHPQPDRRGRSRRIRKANPIHAIAVAGTPTSLAAIDQELEPYDPGRVHGYRLGLKRVQRMLSRLSSLPLAERLRVPGLHPGRAPTIVAGTVILVQVMRAFGLQEIEVSELDILHGSALSAAMAPA